MSKFRVAGLAGLLVVSALVGGTIIGSVAAVSAPPPTQTTPFAAAPSAAAVTGGKAAQFCADFRRAFAANLGVAESALGPAAKQAAISAIDAAVAAGRMTAAAGDRLKARIESADANGCALLAGRLRARAGAAGSAAGALGVVKDGLAAAANALGMTPAELAAELRAGHTLQDVATTKNVPYATVSAAVVAAVRSDLDKAVAAGRIKQVREDRILARLQVALVDGRLRAAPQAPAGPTGSAAPSGS